LIAFVFTSTWQVFSRLDVTISLPSWMF